MYFKINKKWQLTFDIIMIILATSLMGFAFTVFLESNDVSTGGFSGLAMIIDILLSKIGLEFISSSIIYFVLNIFLFILAIKTLGKKFALKSLVGITWYSVAMELFNYIPFNIQYDVIISSVYGGTLMGLGIGLVLRFGGSTGGSDMIASIIRNKTSKFSIGKIVTIVNLIVIFMSLFVFSNGIQLLPYTIIALLLSSFATDFINDGYKQIRAYTIITKMPQEVSEKIMKKLYRGCTLTKVTGMHNKEDRFMLTCLVSKYQTAYLKNIIKNIDPEAFIYSTNVTEVIGAWASTEKINSKMEAEKKLEEDSKKKESTEKDK